MLLYGFYTTTIALVGVADSSVATMAMGSTGVILYLYMYGVVGILRRLRHCSLVNVEEVSWGVGRAPARASNETLTKSNQTCCFISMYRVVGALRRL